MKFIEHLNRYTAIAIVLTMFGAIPFAVGKHFSPEVASLKNEAIERGYALYCPKTGDWAWVGDCHE